MKTTNGANAWSPEVASLIHRSLIGAVYVEEIDDYIAEQRDIIAHVMGSSMPADGRHIAAQINIHGAMMARGNVRP